MSERRDLGFSEGSPALCWPYHHATVVNRTVFVAGQIGVRGTPPQEQAVEAYRRVGEQLAAAGAVPDDVVREEIILSDAALTAVLAKVHNSFYTRRWPPTTTVITGRNGGPDIEIQVTTVIGSGA